MLHSALTVPEYGTLRAFYAFFALIVPFLGTMGAVVLTGILEHSTGLFETEKRVQRLMAQAVAFPSDAKWMYFPFGCACNVLFLSVLYLKRFFLAETDNSLYLASRNNPFCSYRPQGRDSKST